MKMGSSNKIFWAVSMFTILILACAHRQTYNEVVAEELARKVRFDSLFHGLYFDMPMTEFYEYGYEMNQKGIFFQNAMNVEVIVHYDDEYSSPVDFVFFPDEKYPSIQIIRGYMKYRRWSPFAKDLTAAKLQEEIKEIFEKRYGGRQFMKIVHPEGHWPYAYVKVDGNRKILLYRSFDDQKVELVFENLDNMFE